MERNFTEFITILTQKSKTIPYFIGLFPVSTHLNLSETVLGYIKALCLRWKMALSKMDNVHLVDFTELGEFYNISQVFDLRKDQAGHLPFSDKYYAAKGTSLARKVHSWQKQHFKVIVLDCDNTLWQGVCGEDGTLGVKIEGPYLELQKFMLQKHDDGMLLVLCSKNNEPDVWDVFDRNPEMVLKRDYISNWKINWQPKSENIKALAKELNLGIDSFIFIDDNPLECSEVMTNCPEVLTLLLPKDKKQIAVFLQHVWAFDRFKVTDEDKKRTKMYIAERKRQEVQQSGMNLENFLAGLELKMSMNYMEKANLARVSQLTQRTNQFNLSTTRRTEEEIEKLLQNEDTECWTIQVSDCFGDYGVVGVVITHKGTEELFIDTFLLSCRVLGRRVEDAILIGLKKYCQEYNLNQIEARFYPTAKNTPFKEFLERTAWEKEEETAEYIKYNLITEKLSDSSECIELYINSDYSKKLIDEANNHVSAVSKLGESIPTNMYQPEEMNLVFSEKNWQIQIVNEENLLHRKQLLPLENYSGELLAKLPVISINEQKLKRAEYVGPRDETEEKLVQIYDY